MQTTKPDIHRVLAFHDLLLKFQAVDRVLPTPPTFRNENDVEHSYHLAMMGWFLSSYFPELNTDKVIRHALVHDLVEVHAGDTYVFADKSLLASKQEREAAALQQLEQEWSDFGDLTATIHEYEHRQLPEANFVYALDKIMPMLVNVLTKGYGWHRNKMKLDQLHAVKVDKVALSPEVNEYYQQLYELLLANPQWFPDDEAKASASKST